MEKGSKIFSFPTNSEEHYYIIVTFNRLWYRFK